MPLHFTGNGEADELLSDDPMALLIGFALDQQVTVPTAFSGPLKIKQRVGTLEPRTLAATDLEPVFREKPAVHRFPGSMARRVQDLAGQPPDAGRGRQHRAADIGLAFAEDVDESLAVGLGFDRADGDGGAVHGRWLAIGPARRQ